MKFQVRLLAVLFLMPSLAYCAEKPEQALTRTQKARVSLQQLKKESDTPKLSNESDWMSYASKTELTRLQSIRELQAGGAASVHAVRHEMVTAKGKYRQMLTIALAALGDNDSIRPTVNLMLHAQSPTVRVVAAMELRSLKNKELIAPFKQALRDPFKRRDGSCVDQSLIYPIRLVASDALVNLGLPLQEVKKIGRWRD